MNKQITVALAGNPNSGKTTFFNRLTGSHQHVGNYPGVTIEKKEGFCDFGGYQIRFVDLPGTYSLTPYSQEELVARSFILDERPDVVIDVIDSSNVERNLYLATQIIEMEVPLVLAFNMADEARRHGLQFDLVKLTSLLQTPIVETVGKTGEGMEELLETTIKLAQSSAKRSYRINYGKEIELVLGELESLIVKASGQMPKYDCRWLAIKLLEQDKEVMTLVQDATVLQYVAGATQKLSTLFGESPEIVIAERRYGFISGACQETVKSTVELRHSASDTIDSVVTDKVMGLPIFLILMYLAFQITFTLGGPFVWILETAFGWLGATVSGLWAAGSDSWMRSLLVDGIIGGVGGVLTFLPNVMFLFLSIAILEDSGYMARAAFVVDQLMHKIGLHGKSFIPMLIGFGCSVPAIMATRILENRRNRFTTIMVIPLMSCGARYPIYALIIPAFFPQRWQGPVLWLMYLTGIVLAVICAKLLRMTIFKGETIPFVMELPPYRMPTWRGLAIHMWERGWLYLKKAGTTILLASVVMWVLTTYPKASGQELAGLNAQQASQVQLTSSAAGRIGSVIEPVLRPMGFDWKIGTGLIGAFAAKEVFVSQLGVVYAVGDEHGGAESLRQKLKASYTPLTGLCIMLFCLIAMPCMATVAITKAETGQWRWAIFQLVGLTVLGYIVTTIVYQVGRVFL